ncbi:gtpase slip-gc [Fusarium pseudocircinatum]|uniref:Gtpase slip-gc n=1 Tax=Fusarium pseudocircinatum TaxID=56676 RepID=A0A8H5P352_9HYPO|nr:gtpase slip-gc [Fusarium pseudocircinatum]
MDTVQVTEEPPSVKRERTPSPEPEAEVRDVKRQAEATSAVVRTPPEFPWRTCQQLSDVERLKIKEKAVRQAELDCQKIRNILEIALFRMGKGADTKDAIMMGRNIIKEWVEEHENLYKKYENLQILVGVEGPTGAGKSSFLGSLLRIPELFPSGQEAAATAVIGKISWNDVDDPEYAFRAKIIHRKKEDIESDIESLLVEINRYSDLMANKYDHQDDEDSLSIEDAKTESKNKIDYELPKIRAVWGIEKRDLEIMASRCPEKRCYTDTVQSILSRNKAALKILEKGTLNVNRPTAKQLSALIKPYLDSTTVQVGTSIRYAVWPLVKEVHIYAKADILKPGITLVDLPGCGDATTSRSEVAQKFSNQLDVRMVVSPIIRATDEKQAQSLMQSGFDEAQMRIRGKLDGTGFGVIVSKMDEIKVDSYISGCDELCDDQEILQKEAKIVELKGEKSNLKSQDAGLKDNKKRAEGRKRKAKKDYRLAFNKHQQKLQTNPKESDEEVKKLQDIVDIKDQELEAADRALDEHQSRQGQIENEMAYLKDWLHHRASQTRNRRVKERMRDDFITRQAEYDDVPGQRPQSRQEYVLPIFPVSTKAFWQLQNNDAPLEGFPSIRFTGVPAAEQWLHRATLSKREKHLDETLDGYQSLMAMMRIYSQTSGHDGNFNFSRSQVEGAVAKTHETFAKKLSSKLAEACLEIQKLDPLEHRQRAMNRFVAEAKKIVQRWAYKFPDVLTSTIRMHWGTYYANICRYGAEYTSFSTPRVTYNWMKSLASPVIKTLGKDWDNKMNKKLPKIRKPMMAGFSQIWEEYLDQLQKDISNKVPALEVSFNNMRPVLNTSQRSTENQIRKAIEDLSQKASSVAFDSADYLTDEMKPTFEMCMETDGRDSYRRRRAIINGKVEQDVEPMCNEMLNRLAAGLADKKAEVPGELIRIADEAIRGVKQQLSFLVNNLVENSADGSKINIQKTELQTTIRGLVEAWEDAWAEEGDYPEHVLDLDLSIPEEIPAPLELDEENQDDFDLDMFDDEDVGDTA